MNDYAHKHISMYTVQCVLFYYYYFNCIIILFSIYYFLMDKQVMGCALSSARADILVGFVVRSLFRWALAVCL